MFLFTCRGLRSWNHRVEGVTCWPEAGRGGEVRRGWLKDTVQLHRRNDLYLRTELAINFKIATRLDFGCSQNREVINVLGYGFSSNLNAYYILSTHWENSTACPINMYNHCQLEFSVTKSNYWRRETDSWFKSRQKRSPLFFMWSKW